MATNWGAEFVAPPTQEYPVHEEPVTVLEYSVLDGFPSTRSRNSAELPGTYARAGLLAITPPGESHEYDPQHGLW
jgi:hypothetical protein